MTNNDSTVTRAITQLTETLTIAQLQKVSGRLAQVVAALKGLTSGVDVPTEPAEIRERMRELMADGSKFRPAVLAAKIGIQESVALKALEDNSEFTQGDRGWWSLVNKQPPQE